MLIPRESMCSWGWSGLCYPYHIQAKIISTSTHISYRGNTHFGYFQIAILNESGSNTLIPYQPYIPSIQLSKSINNGEN